MTMMKKDMLESAKLTEEEMNNVAGGGVGTEAGARIYTYTVKKGDCLSVIAERLGVRMTKLIDWNAAKYPTLRKNPDYIQTGWKLKYYK